MTETSPQNILDALLDGLAKPKEIHALLVKEGSPYRQEMLEDRYCERTVRTEIRNRLKEWLKTRSFVGKGTKRLLDKAVSEIMDGYKSELRSVLAQDANEAEREAKSFPESSLFRTVKAREAYDIRAALTGGRVGRGKERWPPCLRTPVRRPVKSGKSKSRKRSRKRK